MLSFFRTYFVALLVLLSASALAQTFQQNVACAENAVAAAPVSAFGNPAQKSILLGSLRLAGQYAVAYPSLSAMLLEASVQRTDGCALRGSPDSYLTGGPYGVDYIVVCSAQSVPYSCISAAQAQLP